MRARDKKYASRSSFSGRRIFLWIAGLVNRKERRREKKKKKKKEEDFTRGASCRK
jgi:hypothetical protein